MGKPKVFDDGNYWSPSRLEMLSRCGIQYEFRYVRGIVLPPGIAQAKGTGFHAGAAVNFEQKADTHEDLPADDIVAAAVAAFEGQCKGGLSLSREEEEKGKDTVIGAAIDSVAAMAGLFADEVAPQYQPVPGGFEKPFRLQLPGRDLVGVIDLETDQEKVVDFKTAGKKKSQSDADESIQLTVYHAAFQAEHGKPPADIQLDVTVQTPAGALSHQVLTTSRDAADYDALAARINAAERVLQTGSFTPAPAGSWWCSEKFCGYWHQCPFVNPNRGNHG